MKLTHEIVSLRTKHAFTIARGGGSEYRVNLVTITDRDGAKGVGEANPSRYYGENPDTAAVVLDQFATILDKADAWSLDAIEIEMNRMWRGNGSAKSAVMSALYDLMGKRLGVPLYKMWGLDPAAAPLTSFTIGVAPEAELRTKVQEAAEYPLLKVKLGTPNDAGHHPRDSRGGAGQDPARRRERRMDAQAGARHDRAARGVRRGVRRAAAAAAELEGLRFVRDRSPLPIIARRVVRRRERHSEARGRRWTGSTSSSPSAAARARRCG